MIGARMDLRLKGDFVPDQAATRGASPPWTTTSGPGASPADADWGEMVCRCEHVTRAEVVAALRNPFGARTLDAVKRRTRCGMGRCQGGFCTPRIVEILQDEGVPVDRITKRGGGSRLFYGRLKG